MSDELSLDREKAGDLQTEQRNRLIETRRQSNGRAQGKFAYHIASLPQAGGKEKYKQATARKRRRKVWLN